MAVSLVRARSVTPNISNYDDTRILRYATGGFNGVVSGFGNEMSYTVDGLNFKINSGEFIYQGWQSRIDTSGATITIDNIGGTQYYVVYLQIDLSDSENEIASVLATYDTSSYPSIDPGDDLTTVQGGVARVELYRFEASSGVISNVSKRFSTLEIGKVLNAVDAENAINAENSINAELAITQDVSDDSDKISTTRYSRNKNIFRIFDSSSSDYGIDTGLNYSSAFVNNKKVYMAYITIQCPNNGTTTIEIDDTDLPVNAYFIDLDFRLFNTNTIAYSKAPYLTSGGNYITAYIERLFGVPGKSFELVVNTSYDATAWSLTAKVLYYLD